MVCTRPLGQNSTWGPFSRLSFVERMRLGWPSSLAGSLGPNADVPARPNAPNEVRSWSLARTSATSRDTGPVDAPFFVGFGSIETHARWDRAAAPAPTWARPEAIGVRTAALARPRATEPPLLGWVGIDAAE